MDVAERWLLTRVETSDQTNGGAEMALKLRAAPQVSIALHEPPISFTQSTRAKGLHSRIPTPIYALSGRFGSNVSLSRI